MPLRQPSEPGLEAVRKYGETLQALLDSGAVSAYRPAISTKPQSLLNRVGAALRPYDGWIDPRKTTQQGTAAASQSTYFQTLWPQRFEKAQYNADLWFQYFNDAATFRSVNMYVYEAVRGGPRIRIQGKDRTSQEAQRIADRCMKLWPVHGGPTDGASCFGYGVCQIVTGDLFVQGGAKANPASGAKAEIVRFLNMPAAGMERNTDDADQFINTEKAYSQVDTQTWNDVTDNGFPLWSVYHGRANWVPGTKYGISDIFPTRRLVRSIELLEACKITQVQTRSPLRYLWMIGNKDNPADEATVRTVMALNGFVAGKRAIFDPTEISRDFFSSGITDIKALDGDPRAGDVEHLRYFLDRSSNALPTPRQLMSLGSENINRDVLQDIRAQWMASTVRLNEYLDGPIRWFFELELEWNGIDPSTIVYELLWTKSSTESEKDRVATIITEWEAGLMSRETAVSLLQEYTQIADVKEEITRIQKDAKERTDQEVLMRQAGVTIKDKAKDEGLTKTNGKSNGAMAGVR